MKNKIVIGAVFVAALCFVLAFVVFPPCKDDVCIQKEIDSMRTEKDAYQGRINNLNLKINDLKKGFSAGYVIQQIQTQHTQNVHPDILTLRSLTGGLIQTAHAATGDVDTMSDVSISSDSSNRSSVGLTKIAPQINSGRYFKVLAEKGSPYASTPIEKYCSDAGYNAHQCDLLVGVAQSESQSGTDFTCNSQTKFVSNLMGQFYYHNPVGMTDNDIHYKNGKGMAKTPDENGCYLRKFDSWESFWSWYVPHMAETYKWNKIDSVDYLSGCYVKGSYPNGTCLPPATNWVNTINSFASKVVSSNL